MDLMNELDYDDLDETQQELADCIGMEAYKKLVMTYSGESVTVRVPERITLKLRNEKIRSEFDGGNYRELALRYGICSRSIRRIIKEGYKKH